MVKKMKPNRALSVLLLTLVGCTTTAGRSTDEQAVLDVVQTFFDAMETRDVSAAEGVVFPEGVFISVRPEDGDGNYRNFTNAQFLEGLAARESEVREFLTGIPTVLVDGDVAIVWADYTFEVDGELSHTGVDAFTLLRTEEGWKLAGGAYSVIPSRP